MSLPIPTRSNALPPVRPADQHHPGTLLMNTDLGFGAAVYGVGSGLFFAGYALFEVPSNILLMRFGELSWIARSKLTWGLISAGMIFAAAPLQFYDFSGG